MSETTYRHRRVPITLGGAAVPAGVLAVRARESGALDPASNVLFVGVGGRDERRGRAAGAPGTRAVALGRQATPGSVALQ